MTNPKLSQEDRRLLNQMSNASEPIQLVVIGRYQNVVVCEDLEEFDRDRTPAANHRLLDEVFRAVREDQLLDPTLD